MYSKKEYMAWWRMIDRCYNSENISYPDYGGRGIKVCDRWLDDKLGYGNFLSDMGKAPSGSHSLDRHPNNETGHYDPTNCRWATEKQQSRNRRSNLSYEINGETNCLVEWCEVYNANYSMVISRVRSGMPILDALTTPAKETWTRHPNKLHLTYNGESGDLLFWSKKTGLNYYTILGRVRKGWSVEETITTLSERYPNKTVKRPKNAGNNFKSNFLKMKQSKI